MTPRSQRIALWLLLAGIFVLSLLLLRGCVQARQRLVAPADETPIGAPGSASDETATLLLASDADFSITSSTRTLSLPEEPTIRARSLLEHLLSEYSLPGSAHPLQSGPAVDDVFLLQLPLSNPSANGSPTPSRSYAPSDLLAGPGQLAVVNLHGAFADNHPSGVETEALTLQSIIGTLHANLPDLTAVRFLVDGHTRDTLAGHADLSRVYPASDTSTRPTLPSAEMPSTQP